MNIHKSGQAGLEKYCQGFCTLCGTSHAEQIRDYREMRTIMGKEIEHLLKTLPDLERKLAVAREAMADVRSELSSWPIDRDWCIDQLCAALKELE